MLLGGGEGGASGSTGFTIAFHSDRDGNDEIYIMNADGSGQMRLTNDAARDIDPAFSPDGLLITFVTNRDVDYEIYVMNVDGSNPTNLTNNAARDEFSMVLVLHLLTPFYGHEAI